MAGDTIYRFAPCCPTGFRQGEWRYNTLVEPDPDAATGAENVLRAVCQACGRKVLLSEVKPEPVPGEEAMTEFGRRSHGT